MSKPKEQAELFSEFPPVSTQEWELKIKQDLRGADYRQKLRWDTGEGIDTLPFYRSEDLDALELPELQRSPGHKKNEWEIRQPIFDRDVNTATETARKAVARGADALLFQLHILSTEGMLGGDLSGTAVQSQQDFDDLIADLDLTQTALHFDSRQASPALLAMLYNTCRKQNLDAEQVNATFLYDPFTFTIKNGHLPKPEEAFMDDVRQMVEFCDSELPEVRCLGVDGITYHNAGATIIQELGYSLAVANEYLGRLTDRGLGVEEIAPCIHFNFSIGSNYFPEIAKFRAARILWKMLTDAYGADQPDTFTAYLHGRSSSWNKTMYDPHTNMLRTTTEGMSAAVAGCDSLTLDPFDHIYRQPDDFSQRVARNTQTILKEEAYLNQVEDPAAGSYYVEVLTDKIARSAWECFREIEQQGGFLKSVRGGYVQTAIEESREERDRAIASRGRVFVGASKYANAAERAPESDKVAFTTVSLKSSEEPVEIDPENLIESMAEALKESAMLGDLMPVLMEQGKHDIRPIRTYRGAQAFEEMRLGTEKHEKTPTVLTLPVGDKRMRKARSAFAVNFFSCVGYDITDPIGFDSVEEAAEAVEEHQPDIVVICSSDKEYEQLVPQLSDRIVKLNEERIVVVAGDPKEKADKFTSLGVDAFIHKNTNVLDTLKWFQEKLNVL